MPRRPRRAPRIDPDPTDVPDLFLLAERVSLAAQAALPADAWRLLAIINPELARGLDRADEAALADVERSSRARLGSFVRSAVFHRILIDHIAHVRAERDRKGGSSCPQ